MGKVIDRRPAHIHPHIVPIDGDKVLFGADERVVKFQGRQLRRHKVKSPGARVYAAGSGSTPLCRENENRAANSTLADNGAANNAGQAIGFHGAHNGREQNPNQA